MDLIVQNVQIILFYRNQLANSNVTWDIFQIIRKFAKNVKMDNAKFVSLLEVSVSNVRKILFSKESNAKVNVILDILLMKQSINVRPVMLHNVKFVNRLGYNVIHAK